MVSVILRPGVSMCPIMRTADDTGKVSQLGEFFEPDVWLALVIEQQLMICACSVIAVHTHIVSCCSVTSDYHAWRVVVEEYGEQCERAIDTGSAETQLFEEVLFQRDRVAAISARHDLFHTPDIINQHRTRGRRVHGSTAARCLGLTTREHRSRTWATTPNKITN